ncbi:cell division protein ZipA [Shewanella avicenniae]|uniref:Cell division protein ZipA n=1 Tax=Shewanella avicenniae TaxID=2814294 RepID=A0ABX7QUZ2_9GAMM|nr:cell division protein ZipA [Shewanella avicenniae]QSX35089.1 cell division protein ZipA [Shewanella avicenniae]
MEDLQPVLIVLSAIAIIAVLAHGFWSIRKQQPKGFKESPLNGLARDEAKTREAGHSRDRDGFDAEGVGEVRVRKMTADDRPPKLKTTKRPKPAAPVAKQAVKPVEAIEPTFELTNDVSQRTPKSQRQEPTILVEPEFEVKKVAQMELGLATDAEPEDIETTEAVADADEALPPPRDVLALHVVAKNGEQLSGAELLPALLALNFKFGDMQIFHRHEDNAGHGKVLFSLANMVKPGVFDPDNMEQFTTVGVVLFMTLPCYGDALFNFSNMLNSAQQLADDLNANLLDGERQLWSEQIKMQYLARIKTNA